MSGSLPAMLGLSDYEMLILFKPHLANDINISKTAFKTDALAPLTGSLGNWVCIHVICGIGLSYSYLFLEKWYFTFGWHGPHSCWYSISIDISLLVKLSRKRQMFKTSWPHTKPEKMVIYLFKLIIGIHHAFKKI